MNFLLETVYFCDLISMSLQSSAKLMKRVYCGSLTLANLHDLKEGSQPQKEISKDSWCSRNSWPRITSVQKSDKIVNLAFGLTSLSDSKSTLQCP